MKVASKSCKYIKNDTRRLFLSEHRRCYAEIFSYCNKLVYKGNLESMRGMGASDKKYKLRRIPHMGFRQVATERALRMGSSRYNRNERSLLQIGLLKTSKK